MVKNIKDIFYHTFQIFVTIVTIFSTFFCSIRYTIEHSIGLLSTCGIEMCLHTKYEVA